MSENSTDICYRLVVCLRIRATNNPLVLEWKGSKRIVCWMDPSTQGGFVITILVRWSSLRLFDGSLDRMRTSWRKDLARLLRNSSRASSNTACGVFVKNWFTTYKIEMSNYNLHFSNQLFLSPHTPQLFFLWTWKKGRKENINRKKSYFSSSFISTFNTSSFWTRVKEQVL